MCKHERKKIQAHINDTLVHKQLLINSCLKMINYLFECGRDDDALELAKRCSLHDHSKLEPDEIYQFIKLPIEETGKRKRKAELSDEQRKLIELHWSRNRHHPEFFGSYKGMSEIDILEMVCDWSARSKQFHGEDFIDYVSTTQRNRFGFDEETFEKILVYCRVLEDN